MPHRETRLASRVGLPNSLSVTAFVSVAALLAASVASIEVSGAALVAAKDWVVGYFDWLFVALATAALLGVSLVAAHPAAKARLGTDHEPPEFGYMAWFSMLFSAGLASGLLYWATAEPILHLQDNPFVDFVAADGLPEARATALRLTVFHWGLHGWAFYVIAALAIGIQSYRHGRPLTFRSALYPLLGNRFIDRWPGRAIDLLALFGTVCGVATSIGLAAAGINATLFQLVGLEVGLVNQTWIVVGVCGLGVISALSGLVRGIRWLSGINLWISAGLLLAVAALGPTLYLAALVVHTFSDYALTFLSLGTWLAGTTEGRAWQSAWTVFYWAWWLAWTPFVSLFIARISKGRSIREFVFAVMLVPALVIIVWMSVFGGSALHQEMAQPGAVSTAVNQDHSLGLVTVIGNLGYGDAGIALVSVAAFLLFTWLITSLDSATLVICHLLGVEESAPAKVLWGSALAAVSCALMWVGGVPALQAASILVGLPLAALITLVGASLLGDLFRGRI